MDWPTLGKTITTTTRVTKNLARRLPHAIMHRMSNLGVNLWWNCDVVAFGETDQANLVPGQTEQAIATRIGRAAGEIVTLREGPDTMTVTALVFTNRGRELLGNPETLYAALNGQEFEIEIFDSNGTSLVRYPRCSARQHEAYLTIPIDESVHASITFAVLGEATTENTAAKRQVQQKVQNILQAGSGAREGQFNKWAAEHVKELAERRPDLLDEISRTAANDIERQIGQEGRTGFIDVTSGRPKAQK